MRKTSTPLLVLALMLIAGCAAPSPDTGSVHEEPPASGPPASEPPASQPPASLNEAPIIDSLGASSLSVPMGNTLSVAATAHDPNAADTLSYAWSASCAGTWNNASSSTAQFTSSALPQGACDNCLLTVSVSDGKGGQTQGTLSLCITAPATQHSPPVIVRSQSSSDSARSSQVLSFEVEASDPENSALTFSWAANTGTLGTADTGASTSRITWTAPFCLPASATLPTLVATVTNAFNLTATRSFTVTGVPTCGSWSSTGSMASPRFRHTATLLTNGKVLVAGGEGVSGGILATAEVYDPASGTWSATGSMASPRQSHTATLLPDGKVLVAGGVGVSGGILATAEVYDPVSGTWSATGSMASTRTNHTATLLLDGKVLVVAGNTGASTSSNSAEVYNPATGTWSAAESYIGAPRSRHTATLLPNGTVLVAAGLCFCFRPTSIEGAVMYYPGPGGWAASGSLASARHNHTATLLPNGQVLVTGGTYLSYDQVSTGLATAEVRDASNGTWSAAGSMNSPRQEHTATLLPNGRVLVAGGWPNSSTPLATAEEYDPASRSWSSTGSMLSPRGAFTATLLPNGQVLVTGGWSGSLPLAAAELYTPRTNPPVIIHSQSSSDTATPSQVLSFEVVADDPQDSALTFSWSANTGTLGTADTRASTSRITWTAPVCLRGGIAPVVIATVTNALNLTATRSFTVTGLPFCDAWASTGAMAQPRMQHKAVSLSDGRVLAVGSYNFYGPSDTVELYNPATGTWSATGSMSVPRAFQTITLLPNGKVLAAGGLSGIALATAEVYDPATGTWSATGSMSEPRLNHSATLLPNGKVLVAGGAYAGALATAEVYDPATGTWSATGSMYVSRWGHSATLLPNGKVLIAGGQYDSSSDLSLAEVYDPATGTWSFTRSMNQSHRGIKALLLPNGKVIAFGDDYYSAPSVELYDPATGIWSVTASMRGPRSYYAATLLSDGQVLVVGGESSTSSASMLTTAEVYDPATGAWRAVNSMSQARAYPTATLLPDGRVLVAGGQYRDTALTSAELYTP